MLGTTVYLRRYLFRRADDAYKSQFVGKIHSVLLPVRGSVQPAAGRIMRVLPGYLDQHAPVRLIFFGNDPVRNLAAFQLLSVGGQLLRRVEDQTLHEARALNTYHDDAPSVRYKRK